MRRIHALDYVKTFLAFIVVLAHTNWLQNHLSAPVFVLGNGILRMVVPLFCVIAGYFLHVSVARGKTGRWLWRVMALYLFWMAAYLPIWAGGVHGVWSLTTTLLWGFFHLWFLIGLFFAGLFLAGMNALGRRLAPQHVHLFIAVPAIVLGLLGLAVEYADLFGYIHISEQRYRNGLLMCFPFLAMGYLIRSRVAAKGEDALPKASTLWPIVMLGMALLVAEAWVVQAVLGQHVMIEEPIATYLAVPALFLLCLRIDMPPQPVDLGLISATIYFLHIWAFRLAEYLDVHHLFGLMAFGIGVPTLIALVYGAVVTRLRQAQRHAAAPQGTA